MKKQAAFIFCLAFAAVAVAAAQNVAAQGVPSPEDDLHIAPPPDIPVRHIDSVVVRSRYIDRSMIPAQVLEGDDLRRLSVVSVADAIRYFSGVQIKDYGGVGGLKTVNVRSMGSQHVGVFYDGVQFGNAQNGIVDLGRFSMDNMEAVALYNGQKSDIFQPAKDFASAGSVYLTTRRPVFEANKKYNLRLSALAGSFWTAGASVLWEHRLGKNADRDISSQLSAEFLYTTGRYRFRTRKVDGYDVTEERRNGDVRAVRAEWGLFGRLKRGDWRTKLYYYDSERGYPGYVKAGDGPGVVGPEDRQWDRNFFAQAAVRRFLGHVNLSFNAKYAYDWLHYLARPGSDDSPTNYFDNRYRQQEGYLSAASEFRLFDWWRMSLSADWQFNALDAAMKPGQDGFAYPSRATVLAAAASAFEWRAFEFQASVLYTFVRDGGGGGRIGESHRWTPTAAAMVRPFRKVDLSVRAFYKRIFRMPTLNDIYYSFTGSTYSNVKPEFTTQYNVGLAYSTPEFRGFFRRLGVQVDGYFNQVSDKIVYIPQSNQFRWMVLNLGYVEIRGVDAALTVGLRAGGVGIDIRANYTFQRAQDLTPAADVFDERWVGGQIPYAPWHSGSATVALSWCGWSLDYSFIYTGERYTSRANTPENYLQPWYTHDLALSKAIRLKRSELRVTGELNNMLNQPYEVVRNYPMPGINFMIKLDWTI